jgi:hypothetical protein
MKIDPNYVIGPANRTFNCGYYSSMRTVLNLTVLVSVCRAREGAFNSVEDVYI